MGILNLIFFGANVLVALVLCYVNRRIARKEEMLNSIVSALKRDKGIGADASITIEIHENLDK